MTVLLALFVGLAGGIVLAAVAASGTKFAVQAEQRETATQRNQARQNLQKAQ